ncbi:MAG: hypothetical protein ACLBM1_11820 [Cuspidothrix sp.]|jgi:hypothetical protein|nr:hypothetical protein [Cuspidothrix issatschenkoi]
MANGTKILQVKNGKIQGNLSSADIEAFQIFAQRLEEIGQCFYPSRQNSS